jgi:hypothetical protein
LGLRFPGSLVADAVADFGNAALFHACRPGRIVASAAMGRPGGPSDTGHDCQRKQSGHALKSHGASPRNGRAKALVEPVSYRGRSINHTNLCRWRNRGKRNKQ